MPVISVLITRGHIPAEDLREIADTINEDRQKAGWRNAAGVYRFDGRLRLAIADKEAFAYIMQDPKGKERWDGAELKEIVVSSVKDIFG
jgi:hypothetical protein